MELIQRKGVETRFLLFVYLMEDDWWGTSGGIGHAWLGHESGLNLML